MTDIEKWKRELKELKKMNPRLETMCWRALSAVNFCRCSERDEEFIDMLEEAVVAGVMRAHIGERNLGTDLLRNQMSERLFGVKE